MDRAPKLFLEALLAGCIMTAAVVARGSDPAPRQSSAPASKPVADLSGERRQGIASFYADSFAGKTMADGTPMDPNGTNAASRTLPLGTKAQVTNLETGQSATVVIKDRGPYVQGRIVDLSPATARQIGITPRKGLSKVTVAPITVPQPDGTVKRGAAAKQRETIREAALVAAAHEKQVRENSRDEGQHADHE